MHATALALTLLATAARPSQSPPIEPVAAALGVRIDKPVTLDDHQRDVAHRAGSRLLSLCPDCRLGTIDEEGPCGWARANRQVIRHAVAAGHDEEAIVQAYVRTYGADVLAIDTDRGWAALSWVVPYLLILVSLAAVFAVGRRLRRSAPAPGPAPVIAPAGIPTPDARAELERELADLD